MLRWHRLGWNGLRSGGRACGRVLHLIGHVVLGLAILVVLGVGGLAWRLSQGPIALPWLVQRLEAAFDDNDAATRLEIGSAALEWEGFRLGVNHPLDLRLGTIRVTDPQGKTLDEVARLAVSVSFASLLVGHIAPRSIEVEGARLHLVRAADGAVSLNLGLADRLNGGADQQGGTNQAKPTSGGPDLLAELSRPARTDSSPAERGGGRLRLDQLSRVVIQDAALTVTDQALGTDWRAGPVSIDLTRGSAGGVTGLAAVTLASGSATASLTAQAKLDAGGNQTALTATLSPLTPASLAPVWHRLAPLAGIQVPVGADLAAELGPDLALRHFTLKAQAGAGAVAVGPASETITAATLAVDGDLAAVQLQSLHVVLAQADGTAGPALDLRGRLSRQNGRFTARAGLRFDRVAFADLAHYWPAATGGGARPWITQNIPAGVAHDGHFQATIEGPADFSDATITAVTGQLLGDDLTVHWLRPLPPIEHAAAKLTLVNPDVVEITSQGGHVATGAAGITLHDGSIRITGLSAKDQTSVIAIAESGGIADLLTLLANKRLHLLSDHPLPMQNPSGTYNAHLDVQLPLDDRVTIDQIAIKAQAKLAAVHLGNVAAGRNLDAGAFDLAVDNNGLKLNGTAQFAHIPSQLDVALDFRNGPPGQVVTKVAISGNATAAQINAAGLDTIGMVTGSTRIDATYTEPRAQPAQVALAMDLQNAGIDTGQFGWTKPVGAAASARARLVLDHGQLSAVDGVEAQGPSLSITGRADFADGAPQTLLIDHCVIGRTELSGSIQLATRPGEPIRVAVQGAVLDISGQLRRGKSGKPAATAGQIRPTPTQEEPGAPWSVQARFNQVLLAADHRIGPLTMNAQSDGRVIRVARVETTGAVRILATIGPGGPSEGRKLSITAGDAGSVLQALDITSDVIGGRLTLTGQFDDRQRNHPLTGSADLSAFRFANAPAVAQVLQAITVYGLVSALQGPGIAVDRLIAPFRLDSDVLTLNEARAYNEALGVTVKGDIDLANETADLQGTIVPAYAINSFLGNIPLLGRLFSPERGGGLFAVNYSVRGRLADPAVSVNPLSALTPGFLRGVFGIFQKK